MMMVPFMAKGYNHQQESKTKPVKIVYKDGEKAIPNATIYLVYYDPVQSKWIEKSVTSGSDGAASFNVPLNKNSTTRSFFFACTKEELAERKAMAEKDQLRLFRIPDDVEKLTLGIQKGSSGFSNTEGAIQIWGKE